MAKTSDHTGRQIGQVTILRKLPRNNVVVLRPGEEYRPPQQWLARCACGEEWAVPHSRISDVAPSTCIVCAPHNRVRRLHLPRSQLIKKEHPSYGSWYSMWRRCTSPKHTNYKNYGGRGITVCQEWESFDRFVADMGERPEGMSIDRIDNDKGYSPQNCRWATATEQRANQRPTLRRQRR